MKNYDHQKIEKKWQKEWEKKKIYHALGSGKTKKPKYYALMEFPYPSGDGLHTGHVRGYTAMDIISRKRRMQGFNVMYPIGWDAFGLPTENYAIKTGKDPRVVTKKNSDNFRKQFKELGMSFDWSTEINTTDPKYYKWTQWIFLQFLKKGLAYKKKMEINWCPSCKIGLANEEVVAGCCERCGTPVERREKEQWMLAITKYAERLDKDLDEVDFLPHIKLAQRNWIGKSEGAEIEFKLFSPRVTLGENIKVFTTRPDTIFGATYLVLAPEHPFVKELIEKSFNKEEALQYTVVAKKKTEIERTATDKIKTGVEIKGVRAINPANKEEIPVWIADYVFPHYGTGAIMAVPADDERDNEFASKYNLPIVLDYQKAGFEDFGKKITTFKLRDWVFSRQRYWGEPIPVVHCESCGVVPVPEKDLPVELPKLTGKMKNYQPTESGESPLANISKWVNTECPKCRGKAKRETDTMPNWAGSSWYFLRYTDPRNTKEFASMKKLRYWLGVDPVRSRSPLGDRSTRELARAASNGVDWYNGGNEHTTLHLLYSRFWHKFLFDLGLVPTHEPYKKRTSHGLILAEGGEKMSKSRGNVVNPDDIVKRYGADTLRLYEMFMGPFDQAIAWSEESIIGPRRFLERIWSLQYKVRKNKKSERELYSWHLEKTVRKVSDDIEAMKFNTAISSLMIFTNDVANKDSIPISRYETILKLLSPFAPHITEEIWRNLGHKKSIQLESWPKADLSLADQEEVTIVVQVNGRVRGQFKAVRNISANEATDIAERLPEIQKWLEGKEKKGIHYVEGKLINIVV